jgi:hypothetical protein
LKNKVKPLRGNNLSTLSGNMPGATTAFSNFGLNQAMIGSTTDLVRNTNPQETLMFATTKKFNNSAHNPGMGLTV